MMNTGQLARRTRKQDGYKPDGSVEVNRGATIFELFPFAWNHLFFFGLPHFLTANRTHFAEKCSSASCGKVDPVFRAQRCASQGKEHRI